MKIDIYERYLTSCLKCFIPQAGGVDEPGFATLTELGKSVTLEEMHKEFSSPQYDLIIEDGLHSFTASLNTLINFALKYTKKKGGAIVLEDLSSAENLWNMVCSLLKVKGYNAKLIYSGGLILVVDL